MLIILLLVHLVCFAEAKKAQGHFLYCVDRADEIDLTTGCETTSPDYENSDSSQLVDQIECQQTLNELKPYLRYDDEYFEYKIDDSVEYLHSVDKKLYLSSCLPVTRIEIPEKVNTCTDLVFVKWNLDGYKYEGFLNRLGLLVPSSLPAQCIAKLRQFYLQNNNDLRIFKFENLLIINNRRTSQRTSKRVGVLFKGGEYFDSPPASQETSNHGESTILHELSTIRPVVHSVESTDDDSSSSVDENFLPEFLFGPIGAVLLALVFFFVLILIKITCTCCCDASDHRIAPEDTDVEKIEANEQAAEEETGAEQPNFDEKDPGGSNTNKAKSGKRKKATGFKTLSSRFIYSFVSMYFFFFNSIC
jgi:hypothetical protein